VNLKAPLIINHTKMLGRQIILTESDSNMKAPMAATALVSVG
jgi:flagellar assembly factor FliW